MDEKIYTNPFYFDSEKIYLRGQIARINASCTLAPKGLHRFVEESTRDIEDNTPEDGAIKMPVPAALCSLDSWVHLTPSLLKQGKTKHSEPKPGPGDEEVDPEELMKREVAKDPWEPRLKPIAKDNATKGGMPPWVIKSFNISKTDGVVVVRSLWWPGSYTIYANGRSQHIYVGDA